MGEYFIHRHTFCLMMNKKKFLYTIFWCILGLSCALGLIFANVEVNTSLSILPPSYTVIYYPPYITGTYLSGPVYVEITWSGIRSNMSTGIFDSGIYSFDFWRGTWPFTLWSGYSSDNMRNLLTTSAVINRIDNESPKIFGVVNNMTYTSQVTINFSDNLPGVTATLNTVPLTNGTVIRTNWIYELMVTDAVGNTTWVVFYINLSTPGWGNGGRWGFRLPKDNCPLGDLSLNYYDGSCEADSTSSLPSLWSDPEIRKVISQLCEARNCNTTYYFQACGPCSFDPDFSWDFQYPIIPPQPSIFASRYSKERNDAYLRAYNLWIINANTIQKANLEGVLYRKIAAKMASEFAMKVLNILPDTTRTCEFDDISNEGEELQYYMRLSCQLGIMWLDYYGEPTSIFNPNHFVTRDQFVTILSRMLFRETYNLKTEELSFFDKVRNFAVHTVNNVTQALHLNLRIYSPLDWYTKHLEAIKKLWIITNYTITTKEFRIYVLLILYRIDQIGIENIRALVK